MMINNECYPAEDIFSGGEDRYHENVYQIYNYIQTVLILNDTFYNNDRFQDIQIEHPPMCNNSNTDCNSTTTILGIIYFLNIT